MSRSLSYDYEFNDDVVKRDNRIHNLKAEKRKRGRKHLKAARRSWRRFKEINENVCIEILGSK